MQHLVSQDLSFELMTMTPRNAQAFLSQKQPLQAAMLQGSDATFVQICKLGEFYDIHSDVEPLKSSAEIGFCLVYEWINLELDYPELGRVAVVRIRGAAFEDKKSVKCFLKQVEQARKNDPVELA
ncbi:MAG: hypothetical protein JSR46_02060, partial [Verrucomicrobia bacterium]|nr:hypothetical protein [Verrucomicrobiota bacterium]